MICMVTWMVVVLIENCFGDLNDYEDNDCWSDWLLWSHRGDDDSYFQVIKMDIVNN